MIYALIIACEIGFWVFIAAGLAARYLFRRRRLGTVLLAMTPVVDLILLAVTAIHLRSGGEATSAHSLAAIYLGFSIAYGHRMIKWADVRFAHRFAGGPPPVKLYGSDYTRHCWTGLTLTFVAVAIAAGLLALLIALAPDREQTEVLSQTFPLLGTIFTIDLIWTVSYTVWPRKEPKRAPATPS